MAPFEQKYGNKMLASDSLCAVVIAALEDVKGTDIKPIDVRELTSITDYMVICTGSSSRQLRALADNVVKQAKANGVRPYNRNHEKQDEWALVDLGDVIVHIMLAETREYYALEKLWIVAEQARDESDDDDEE